MTCAEGPLAVKRTRKRKAAQGKQGTKKDKQKRVEITEENVGMKIVDTQGENRETGKGSGHPQKSPRLRQARRGKAQGPKSQALQAKTFPRMQKSDRTGEEQYEEALKLARHADRTGGPLPVCLLEEAASTGYAPAQYAWANWHLHGKGVRKDYKLAVSLLRKAAAKKYPPAEYDLAVSYETGKGVRKDLKAAFIWYRRAANNGDLQSQAEVARCYYYGIGTTKNLRKAAEWYLKAATHGDVDSQYAMAIAYERGEGIQQSGGEALRWYRKAASQGNEDSKKAVKELESRRGEQER